MKKLLALVMTAVLSTSAPAAEHGGFEGKVVVEWLDDPLAWRPVVDEDLIGELLGWVRSADPRLEEIDRHAEAAIRARGPHIFEQPPCNQYSGSTRVRWRC